MRRRKVIPLIGEELLQVEIEGKTVPLYAWMAERLASVLEVPSSELPSPASLNDVACQYLARNDSNRNSIYTRLSIIVDEANAVPAPSHTAAPTGRDHRFQPFPHDHLRFAYGVGAQ